MFWWRTGARKKLPSRSMSLSPVRSKVSPLSFGGTLRLFLRGLQEEVARRPWDTGSFGQVRKDGLLGTRIGHGIDSRLRVRLRYRTDSPQWTVVTLTSRHLLPPITSRKFVVDTRPTHEVDSLSQTVPGLDKQRMFRVFVDGHVRRIENIIIQWTLLSLDYLDRWGARSRQPHRR